ncbi:MAG: hypothetical protein A4E62_02406 [Syntrophorhabdus sp. PtaU1.Bin002]|nr:MAG: hypothetical protein A4E62_02406 [Syntrophorhabdus sp. PtaU1.Bin002]
MMGDFRAYARYLLLVSFFTFMRITLPSRQNFLSVFTMHILPTVAPLLTIRMSPLRGSHLCIAFLAVSSEMNRGSSNETPSSLTSFADRNGIPVSSVVGLKCSPSVILSETAHKLTHVHPCGNSPSATFPFASFPSNARFRSACR